MDDPNSFLTKPYSTLDEPVRDTIMRDVRSVAAKLRVVLLPLDRNVSLGGGCVCSRGKDEACGAMTYRLRSASLSGGSLFILY
jgi:hypothetical protein